MKRLQAVAAALALAIVGPPLGAGEEADWVGQAPPGAEPALFAPGLVSTGLYERDLAWLPDRSELYWTIFAPGPRVGTVVGARRGADGGWSEPFVPALFRGHNSLEPFVTSDGGWLWFASDRPLPGESEPGDWNLWRAPRREDGWGEPEPLPAPINAEGDEFYPTLTRDGTVYFTAERDGGAGGEDIFASYPLEDGGWSEPEALGPGVNGEGPEFNSLVHPDGRWILYGSVRAGDQGGGDLYLSFRAADGGWGPGRALPPPLNSGALDFCPALSPDGAYLFFSSRRTAVDPTGLQSHAALVAALGAPGNGESDLYWVDASVLDALAEPGSLPP